MKNRVRSQTAPWFLLLTVLFLLGAASPPARAQDETTLFKDSVKVSAYTHTFDLRGTPPSWSPTIQFRVNGPLADGSRLWAEASFPGKTKWRTGDCYRLITLTNGWECLGQSDAEAVRFTGLVDFAIHISNELQGTNITLFQGKAKVAKTPPRFKGQPNSFEYYVDDDWRVPIGYLSHGRTLQIEMWFRGKPGTVQPFLFFQGKQVAKGENCGGANFEPATYVWWPVDCEFFGEGSEDVAEKLSQAPGEYEIKVLQESRLTRTGKFTVGPDGSFDNGIASANKLGSNKVIVPFKVTVDLAPWDKLAWKTGAFYGNPLTGFTAPP